MEHGICLLWALSVRMAWCFFRHEADKAFLRFFFGFRGAASLSIRK
jgi:hypothetical protein